MKKLTVYSIITVISVILFATSVNADFLCSTEVLYKWAKDGGKSTSVQALNQQKAEGTPLAASETPVSELTVFWANLEEKGLSEAEAKATLTKRALAERVNAEKACLSAHENLSGCIAAKYASLSASVSTLSFSARKAMEDAIKIDCEKQQGKCTGSVVGEAKCSEVVVQAKPTEPAKDAKGKKK